MSVLVAGELGQDLTEMAFAEDQQVIQALTAQWSREPLGKCIRARRPGTGS
jgi:hypothetical protein